MADVAEPGESGSVTFESRAGLKVGKETRAAMSLKVEPVGSGRFSDRHLASARIIGGRGGSEVCLRAVVPAELAPKAGTAAEVLAGGGSKTWAGRVDEVNLHLMAVSGDAEVLVCVPAKPDAPSLEGGLTISYALSEERVSLCVPPAALVRAALGDFVFVSNGDAFLRRRVEVGQLDDKEAEIRSGLRMGDAVVTHGADRLWILELAMVGGMSNLETAEAAK